MLLQHLPHQGKELTLVPNHLRNVDTKTRELVDPNNIVDFNTQQTSAKTSAKETSATTDLPVLSDIPKESATTGSPKEAVEKEMAVDIAIQRTLHILQYKCQTKLF